MDFPVFNPRDSRCKQPYGAVPCATEVTLTLRPLASEHFTACTLLLHNEFAGETRTVSIPCIGSDDRHTIFSGSYEAPKQEELIWYSFRLYRLT